MYEQRKDDNRNRKEVRPTYWERPLLSLRNIPNTQAFTKHTKTNYYYTYPINTNGQTDGRHQYLSRAATLSTDVSSQPMSRATH